MVIVMLISLVRGTILYLLLIFTVRLMGKRQIGQLQPGELVITIMISEIAVIPMQDNDLPLIHSILALFLLAAFEIIISVTALKSTKLRQLLQGNSIIIIKDGTIDQKQLKRLRYTIDDLLEALRQKDVFDISDVQYAIVETNGALSVLLKPEKRPVTTGDASLKPSDNAFKTVLISDGEILKHELENAGMTESQLKAETESRNLQIKNILLYEADKNGNTNIIRKDNTK